MEKVKCPSCGGLSSNYLNCDYCDSFMVRFVARGITTDKSLLDASSEVMQGLQEELQANIEEQINTKSKNHVSTIIHNSEYTIEVCNPRALNSPVQLPAGYITPNNPFGDDEIGLVLVIRCAEYEQSFLSDQNEEFLIKAKTDQQKMQWFEHLGLNKLFIKMDEDIHGVVGADLGICHSFYLNFGRDIVGSARVISQYLWGSEYFTEKKDISYSRSTLAPIEYEKKLRDFNTSLKGGKKVAFLHDLLYAFCITVIIICGIARNMLRIKIGWTFAVITFIILWACFIANDFIKRK